MFNNKLSLKNLKKRKKVFLLALFSLFLLVLFFNTFHLLNSTPDHDDHCSLCQFQHGVETVVFAETLFVIVLIVTTNCLPEFQLARRKFFLLSFFCTGPPESFSL